MQVEMEQSSQKLDEFKVIVKKTVNAEAKAAVRPCSYARNIDQHFFGVVGRQQPKPLSKISHWKTHRLKNLSPRLKSKKPQPFSTPIALRPPNRLRKKRRRKRNRKDATEKKGLMIPPRPPGLIQQILWGATLVEVEMEAKGLKKISLRPSVTIVTRKVILQENA